MRIRVSRPQDNFTMVPNHVLQGTLSADALGVLLYCMSHSHGVTISVKDIQNRFRMGRDRQQRITKELRDADAMTTHPGGPNGGSYFEITWPPEPENQRQPENPAAGKPGTPVQENPAHQYRETRPRNKKENIIREKTAKNPQLVQACQHYANPVTKSKEKAQIRDWALKNFPDLTANSFQDLVQRQRAAHVAKHSEHYAEKRGVGFAQASDSHPLAKSVGST